MKWAYGLTTVPDRISTLLPDTLQSLAEAGFPSPRLFVDGGGYPSNAHATIRNPRVGPYSSWLLGVLELYLRDPDADRYAMFQDDLLTYPYLREYLESCPYPDKGYLNLYTFDKSNGQNSGLLPNPEYIGWYLSNQLGRGALALVFSNEALRALLAQRHMYDRRQDKHRGWRVIDGAIVEAFSQIGYKEYVHMPSLTQHTGLEGTFSKDVMGLLNDEHRPKHKWSTDTQASTFQGKDFDARSLIRK